METDRNPEDLMARYHAGDFAAVTALVECIGPQLHRAYRTLRSSMNALGPKQGSSRVLP